MAALADPRTDGELTARATLLAVRAGLQGHPALAEATYVFPPGRAVLPVDDAARVLAALPKPLFCEAELFDGLVGIRCTEITSPEILGEVFDGAERLAESFSQDLSALCGPEDPDPLLLLRVNQEESLLVRWSVITRWFREYVVTLGMRLDRPDGAALSQGACCVLTLGPVEIEVL
jgi:hypothetical protein